MLNVYKIAHGSKIYGPGVRDVIWFKGCSLHCKNCINPELWSFDAATLLNVTDLISELQLKEVTLLGGEPLQQNDILDLILELKKHDYGIILFTGYEESELNENQKKAADNCDVIIFGRYDESKKDDSLYLRGSTNQKIIFNSNRYKKEEFEKPNSFEVIMNDGLECHGRNKDLLKELFKLNR